MSEVEVEHTDDEHDEYGDGDDPDQPERELRMWRPSIGIAVGGTVEGCFSFSCLGGLGWLCCGF